MKIKHYEPDARALLTSPNLPRTERHYVVPGTGHGYTLDLEKAEKWAMLRSRFIGGNPVPVVVQEVQLGAYEVVRDFVAVSDPEEVT